MTTTPTNPATPDAEPVVEPRPRPEVRGWTAMRLLDQAMRRHDGVTIAPFRHPFEAVAGPCWEADKVSWCGAWRVTWPRWGHEEKAPSVIVSLRSIEDALAYVDGRWPMPDWWHQLDRFQVRPPMKVS